MTKEELMQLADAYAKMYQQALSDAIDAALKKARSDALEEAVEYALDACNSWARNNWQLKDAIHALKEKA